jgi:class 3 adenylate cyclase
MERGRTSIDELLDRAVRAVNSGDRETANALAGRVLEVDRTNVDAEELLAAPAEHGELRRLTIMFSDLVDSTELSTRIEPETYRTVVGRYREVVQRIVNEREGHIGYPKGDGLLAVFGHPQAHEDDARRAVQAGLDITREVAELSDRVRRRFGFDVDVRVGIHRGLVYLDTAQDDVYGFAANLAARLCGIAEPGTIAVSQSIERLVRDWFELQQRPPQHVKGIDDMVVSFRPVKARETPRGWQGAFVGRHRETARLQNSWERAAAGGLTTALAFCGESGIGKSRLANRAVELAQPSAAVVLQLQGSPLATDVGLHPIRDLLERECGITRTSKAEDRLRLLKAELEARALDADNMVPLLAPVLGIPVSAGYAPVPAEGNKLQEHIKTAVHDYLVARIGEGPAVIVAEDMHWFDSASTAALASILPTGSGRLMFVMTSREMAALPDDSSIEVFELQPLTDLEADDLIVALDPQMSRKDRDAVRGRCGGMPLYIEEVVAKLKELQAGGADSATVPDTLYEALFARLRSSEGAVRVVEAAATIGSRFDVGLLQTVAGLTAADLDGMLDELRTSAVFEAVDANTWRFRHELLREVAAELAPPSIGRAIHGRVADALKSHAARGDPNWPSIATHFEQAHRFDEAASAYQMASTTARLRGALGEAKSYLSRALSQLDRVPPRPERDRSEINLRLRRGFLASAALGPVSSEATADFERSLQLSGTDPSSDELFATLMATFTYYVTRADLPRAQQIVDSLRIGVDGGREWWRAENVGGAGTLSWFRGEFDTASDQLESAAKLAAARGPRDVESEWFTPHDPVVLSMCSLALTRMVRGDRAGAAEAIAHSANWASGLGFPQGPFSMCYLRYIEIWMHLEWGEQRQATEAAADMSERAERHGFDQWGGLASVFSSYVAAATALDAGDVDAPVVSNGIATLTGWTTAGRMLEAKVFLPSFDALLAGMLIARGQLSEAARQLTAGLTLADETGMHYYDAELIRLRAKTHRNPKKRGDDIAAAYALARHQGAHLFALRAALDDYELRGRSVSRRVAEAVGLFAADCTSPDLERARALLDGA